MRDERGLYYHARAGDPSVRVYVREGDRGDPEFRLWNAKFPEIWDNHGWVPYGVIKNAAEIYRKERDPDANPLLLYDLAAARSLLKDNV